MRCGLLVSVAVIGAGFSLALSVGNVTSASPSPHMRWTNVTARLGEATSWALVFFQ